MRAAVAWVDATLGRLEAASLGVLVLAMTGVTLAQVFWRYALDNPLIWTEEAARYLFVWVSLIGAALAMQQRAHYALDVVALRLPPRLAGAARCLALLVSAGFLLVLLKAGIAETRQAALQDSSTLPITMDLAYLAIPVGAALMLFHLLAAPFRKTAA